MLLLNANDIRQALPMRQAILTQIEAYKAVAARSVDLPLRTVLPVPARDAVSLFMPARVGTALGAKIVSVFPENGRSGLPSIHGLVVLLDEATGRPEALLDAGYLTALRTAAATAAATDLLSNKDAVQCSILGSGVLARIHILAMCEIRPLQEIRIYSPNESHVTALIQEMQPQVNVRLSAAHDSLTAISDSDIICCATTSSTPVLDGTAVKSGAHVNGVGAYTLQMHELGVEAIRRAGRVFVDSRESVLAEAGDVVEAIRAGALRQEDLVEIGAVLSGTVPGRQSPQAVSVFKSCGLAAQDMLAAAEAVRLAREQKLGTEVSL